MNALRRKLIVTVAALTIAMVLPTESFAQNGHWVREFYGHYFTREDAQRVANDLNRSGDPNIRNAVAEYTPNPVTRTFGVYYQRFQPGSQGQPALASVSGMITLGDPMDRVRRGCHAKEYNFHMTPGRSYTIDVLSGRNGNSGPGYFDAYLRIEDSQGRQVAYNDDAGMGYNARIVFTPQRADNYRLIVTTYRSGATGSFTMTIR